MRLSVKWLSLCLAIAAAPVLGQIIPEKGPWTAEQVLDGGFWPG